jgi:hypothetical protein
MASSEPQITQLLQASNEGRPGALEPSLESSCES